MQYGNPQARLTRRMKLFVWFVAGSTDKHKPVSVRYRKSILDRLVGQVIVLVRVCV